MTYQSIKTTLNITTNNFTFLMDIELIKWYEDIDIQVHYARDFPWQSAQIQENQKLTKFFRIPQTAHIP